MRQIIPYLFLLFIFTNCSVSMNAPKMKNPPLFGLHGKLVAQDGKGKELVGILLEASQLLQSAEGCHIYIVSTIPNAPDEIWVTEIWETKDDHANSLKIPEVQALIKRAIPILNKPPEKGQELEILGGLGIR